ncbi:MAG: hypothetical protein GW856_02135 [Cyanobacteria bacterium]|nr:hypothetical protein [Cyanobacteria bacterium CG_2015-16_32_12]NCO76743.1 hypothetical protein [Cyanobacteria bacterium CG_2015-22_32_23]NCQ04389.1 hypothetical protein [Cyanobacteria bacterium CG_2015-09_32_10]NCS84935.1 hypothetical protein [Cyanobacteria bacterium CG_2015-02_32_10]
MAQTIEVSLIDVLNKIEAKIDHLDKNIDLKIEKLESKIDKLDSKIDTLEEKLESKIDKLDSKIDTLEEKLETKIDALEDKVDTKIEKLETTINNRFNTLTLGFLGIFGVLTGGLLTFLGKIVFFPNL